MLLPSHFSGWFLARAPSQFHESWESWSSPPTPCRLSYPNDTWRRWNNHCPFKPIYFWWRFHRGLDFWRKMPKDYCKNCNGDKNNMAHHGKDRDVLRQHTQLDLTATNLLRIICWLFLKERHDLVIQLESNSIWPWSNCIMGTSISLERFPNKSIFRRVCLTSKTLFVKKTCFGQVGVHEKMPPSWNIQCCSFTWVPYLYYP